MRAELSVSIAGDLGGSSEYATIYVEGSKVGARRGASTGGEIDGVTYCFTDLDISNLMPPTGTLDVIVDMSDEVGLHCGTPMLRLL